MKTMTRRSRRKPPIRSLVEYSYEAPTGETSNAASDADEIEALLEKAKLDNVIATYDTGRGYRVWFEGAPGKELRTLRNTIRSLLPSDWTSTHR
jgi:hypothetical protein